MRKAVALLLLFALPACATTSALDPNYAAYLEARKLQPKIIEIVAKQGEVITLGGVERFIVYDTTGFGVEQYRAQEPPWLSVVREVGITARLIGVPYVIGKTVERIVDKAVDGAGHNVTGSYNSASETTTTTTNTSTTTTNTTTDSYKTDNSISRSYNTDNSTLDGDNSYRWLQIPVQ